MLYVVYYIGTAHRLLRVTAEIRAVINGLTLSRGFHALASPHRLYRYRLRSGPRIFAKISREMINEELHGKIREPLYIPCHNTPSPSRRLVKKCKCCSLLQISMVVPPLPSRSIRS